MAFMTKKLIVQTILGLLVLSSNPAMAHGGGSAKHGGVVSVANDLSFELVVNPDTAHIYLEDHGKPMMPNGIKGKLTALNGSDKVEADLVVVGNKLEAKGVKLHKGAKVVATLTTAASKTITVRFTVK
jgi:hypothetical protein